MLPPESTTPTRAPRGSGSLPWSTAAAPTAPVGSTTSRARSTRKRTVARISGSVTRHTSVRCFWRIGNVSAPGLVTQMPSAIVGGGAVVAQAIVEDDLGPVVARGLELERRRVLGHADDRGRPRHPRRERDALGMVARREGHDPPGALPGREREELVERAADLERARALEPFALEEHAVSAGVVERLRRHDGRAVDAPGEAPRGRVDGVERERGGG